MSNKNVAFNDLCLLTAILGSCTGIFVAIMCGHCEVERAESVGRTVDASDDLNDVGATVCACDSAIV